MLNDKQRTHNSGQPINSDKMQQCLRPKATFSRHEQKVQMDIIQLLSSN